MASTLEATYLYNGYASISLNTLWGESKEGATSTNNFMPMDGTMRGELLRN